MIGIPELEVGTEGTDYTGTFIYRVVDSVPQILVIKYKKYGRESVKIAGGCTAKDERPLDALGNEITQELGLELISMEKVQFVCTNKKVPGRHHQHFFSTPFENLQGELRTVVMEDDDEILGPPYWLSVEDALRELFPSHLRAFERALPVIAREDPEFAMAVSHLL